MAIFKVPRINSEARKTLVLEESELVFDISEGHFFGGNGSDVGGFPVGKGASTKTFIKTLDQSDIQNKFIKLPEIPDLPDTSRLNIAGGIEQIYSVDFSVDSDILFWSGLGLDNFLEVNDTLIVHFV